MQNLSEFNIYEDRFERGEYDGYLKPRVPAKPSRESPAAIQSSPGVKAKPSRESSAVVQSPPRVKPKIEAPQAIGYAKSETGSDTSFKSCLSDFDDDDIEMQPHVHEKNDTAVKSGRYYAHSLQDLVSSIDEEENESPQQENNNNTNKVLGETSSLEDDYDYVDYHQERIAMENEGNEPIVPTTPKPVKPIHNRQINDSTHLQDAAPVNKNENCNAEIAREDLFEDLEEYAEDLDNYDEIIGTYSEEDLNKIDQFEMYLHSRGVQSISGISCAVGNDSNTESEDDDCENKTIKQPDETRLVSEITNKEHFNDEEMTTSDEEEYYFRENGYSKDVYKASSNLNIDGLPSNKSVDVYKNHSALIENSNNSISSYDDEESDDQFNGAKLNGNDATSNKVRDRYENVTTDDGIAEYDVPRSAVIQNSNLSQDCYDYKNQIPLKSVAAFEDSNNPISSYDEEESFEQLNGEKGYYLQETLNGNEVAYATSNKAGDRYKNQTPYDEIAENDVIQNSNTKNHIPIKSVAVFENSNNQISSYDVNKITSVDERVYYANEHVYKTSDDHYQNRIAIKNDIPEYDVPKSAVTENSNYDSFDNAEYYALEEFNRNALGDSERREMLDQLCYMNERVRDIENSIIQPGYNREHVLAKLSHELRMLNTFDTVQIDEPLLNMQEQILEKIHVCISGVISEA